MLHVCCMHTWCCVEDDPSESHIALPQAAHETTHVVENILLHQCTLL